MHGQDAHATGCLRHTIPPLSFFSLAIQAELQLAHVILIGFLVNLLIISTQLRIGQCSYVGNGDGLLRVVLLELLKHECLLRYNIPPDSAVGKSVPVGNVGPETPALYLPLSWDNFSSYD